MGLLAVVASASKLLLCILSVRPGLHGPLSIGLSSSSVYLSSPLQRRGIVSMSWKAKGRRANRFEARSSPLVVKNIQIFSKLPSPADDYALLQSKSGKLMLEICTYIGLC